MLILRGLSTRLLMPVVADVGRDESDELTHDEGLHDAELSQPVTELNMYSIMGGGSIRVPHGVEVHVSNFAFMGGNGVELGDETAPPGAPAIRIRLVSIMGGSDVQRGRKLSREERKRERELRKAKQRELDP